MKKKLLIAGSIILGIAGFCLVPIIVGVDRTLSVVSEAGLGCIVAYFIACLASHVFPAFGWWILLRGEEIRVSPWATIRANIMGFPLNFFTPSMYLGSEPLRLFYISGLTGAPKRQILATIIVSKFQELAGIVFIMIIAALYFAWNTDFFQGTSEVLLLSLTAALAISLGLLFFAFIGDFRPTVKLIHLLARLGIARRKLARLRHRAHEMEEMVQAAFVHRWKRFLVAQGVTLLSSLALFLRPIVFFLFLPSRQFLSMTHAAGIYVITNLASMLTIIPGALGIYDGGVTGYFDAAGLGADRGAGLALVNRISDVAMIVFGVSLLLHTGLLTLTGGRPKVQVTPLEINENKKSETLR